MIIYKNNAGGFINEVETNSITEQIERKFVENYGRRVSESEKRSWSNSMQFMGNIIRRSKIDTSAGILVEYNLPATPYRIDFIVAGEDENLDKNFIIIELIQWEEASSTDKDDVVVSFVGGAKRETTHPSYQATSYKLYLADYNENVYKGDINVQSCAYLHNYKENY